MMNRLLKCFTLLFLVNLFTIGCHSKNETKENPIDKSSPNSTDTVNYFDRYKKKHNLTSNSFDDYKTKYKDGRISEIRTMLTYESFEDSLSVYPKSKTKIVLVVIEWEKSKGVVAMESSAFANQNDNQMNGGDVETNRRISPASKRFIELSEQIFDKNFDKLTKIDAIPNRDLDFVSFDFITNKGIFTVQERLKDLENNQSIWSSYFKEGKNLKSEIVKTINTNEWKGK
jgi:hypothetical protein